MQWKKDERLLRQISPDQFEVAEVLDTPPKPNDQGAQARQVTWQEVIAPQNTAIVFVHEQHAAGITGEPPPDFLQAEGQRHLRLDSIHSTFEIGVGWSAFPS